MSRRHRASRTAERAPKRERRWQTHQERQALRGTLMMVDDPEELVLPEFVHHGPRTVEVEAGPRRRRHWKMKEWKRRTAARRERALAITRLAQQL